MNECCPVVLLMCSVKEHSKQGKRRKEKPQFIVVVFYFEGPYLWNGTRYSFILRTILELIQCSKT